MKTVEKIDLESKYSEKIQPLFELKREGYLNLDKKSFDEYEKFGFTKEDIPELIELAMDDRADEIDYELYEEELNRLFFATISAVRILGKLGAVEAVEPLFNKMYLDLDNDFYYDAIIDFLGDIGEEAIPFIENDLLEVAEDKLTLFDGLKKIIEQHSIEKESVENFLIKYLETTDDNDTHVAFGISNLVDISGAKYIDFIEKIFKTKEVDTMVQGDFEDIEIKLRLKTKRVNPRPKNKFDELAEAFKILEDDSYQEVRSEPKIGRNDPCPCGSGKKYKKCCLNK